MEDEGSEVHPDYDLSSDLDYEEDEVDNINNNHDVKNYLFHTYLNVNELNDTLSDVANVNIVILSTLNLL